MVLVQWRTAVIMVQRLGHRRLRAGMLWLALIIGWILFRKVLHRVVK
uniref:Uncharacterized protein n=1 Tax=Arundo donax TaxID=35708 RepID=A0A0A8ZL49_ARUDO